MTAMKTLRCLSMILKIDVIIFLGRVVLSPYFFFPLLYFLPTFCTKKKSREKVHILLVVLPPYFCSFGKSREEVHFFA